MSTGAMTLASLALIKARYDTQRQDVIDALIPFADHILSTKTIRKFDSEELKEWFLTEFGLSLPLHPVNLLLGRMVKRSHIKKEFGDYVVLRTSGNTAAFQKAKDESQSHLDATVASLIDFGATHLERKIPQEEAETYLFNYIDEYAIECIKAYSSGESVRLRGKDEQAWRFIVSSYVRHISESDPLRFQYFVTVLTGRMLSNALLAADLIADRMKFKETVLYFDTPIILQLLGVLGDTPKILAEEMLQLYHKSSAKFAVFQHTVEEIESILRNAERSLETHSIGHGNVIVALKEAGKTASDVALIRADLAGALSEIGVQVQPTPPYEEKYQIDEEKLEQEMAQAGLFYRSETARKADINSVRSVYVMCSGDCPVRLENCKAVLVTTNSAFARAAFSYGRYFKEFQGVSPVITDFSITNIVWLKSPLDFADLPAKILSANCYAAMRPSEELWTSFLDELKKLESKGRISTEQHQYMRYELRVREELMNLTFGDETQLSEDKILQVLDRREQEVARPFKQRLDELKEIHNRTTTDLIHTRGALDEILHRIEKIGIWVERTMSFILVALCTVFLAFSQGWIGDHSHPSSASLLDQWSYKIVSYLSNLFAVLNVIFGFRMWNPISWIAHGARRVIAGVLGKAFRLPQGQRPNQE